MLAMLPMLLKVIDAAKAAIPAGHQALAGFNELQGKVKQFVDENRDPTPEEFRELQATTDALTNRLEAADRRLSGN